MVDDFYEQKLREVSKYLFLSWSIKSRYLYIVKIDTLVKSFFFCSYNACVMIEDLIREPSGKFENCFRMSYTDFEFILNKVGHMIGKKDTQLRKAIPVKERFCVALIFFATGGSFVSLLYLFKFSPQVVSLLLKSQVSEQLIADRQYKD